LLRGHIFSSLMPTENPDTAGKTVTVIRSHDDPASGSKHEAPATRAHQKFGT
jgi:hypothetical protein